ncbi:MAG TPA: iron-sulfur cluster assembly accessory protein [Xanthomonadales bacterium]|nr:iron-sulfur cluster assembly accessory protein [Xanthomonadales bacterium]
MAIRLTPAAVEHVRRHLSRYPEALGLRLGVKRTGCSGWGYVTDIANSRQADDSLFEQDGVTILVDAASLALIDGTEVDYRRQGLNWQFAFRNPHAVAECGCGESFTTDRAFA